MKASFTAMSLALVAAAGCHRSGEQDGAPDLVATFVCPDNGFEEVCIKVHTELEGCEDVLSIDCRCDRLVRWTRCCAESDPLACPMDFICVFSGHGCVSRREDLSQREDLLSVDNGNPIDIAR